ncbi:hypothetical protein CAPTEDRAFT_210373 [Capitella teleta]|uniref:SHSP domain-containing protein n=1 Tax=Capitella teleta TaxID=283909 RepID=N1PBB1_CAPTE|nr:hypothetical protein CAPTEDRAFT_210373 [Capitella teleta]|eukprot:ELU18895.1 hypothetical protein CAPTEDRAFT_210373 [Capitella teleta]
MRCSRDSPMSSSRLSISGGTESLDDCPSGCSSDGGGSTDGMLVPMERDDLTFAGVEAVRIKEMEKRVEEEMHKRKRRWEREVERMCDEFLNLYPADREWGSDELLNDPLVSRRRGSTDILDKRKMRTLFMDCPDAGRRYKLRFNCVDYEPSSIKVVTDDRRIVVHAKKIFQTAKGETQEMDYIRKIHKPSEVDASKLRSFLTSDKILVIEAPVPPHSLNLRKLSHSPSHSSQASHATQSQCSQGSKGSSSRSRSPSNSPHTPSTLGQKHGIPHFNEDINGVRRFSMILDIGTMFKPKEITVQVIKDNRIQVKAKHEERTSDRLNKCKYFKEFELPDKIEHYTLRGGLCSDGRMILGALAKGELNGLSSKEAAATVKADIDSKSENMPCNVLDLATFPPVAPPT